MINMTAALVRLTGAVSQVGRRIQDVADAIKAHPAAQDDSDQLNALAAGLEAAVQELDAVVAGINAAGQPETPPPPPPPAQPDPTPIPSGDPTPTV